jgi:hypothetical protein
MEFASTATKLKVFYLITESQNYFYFKNIWSIKPQVINYYFITCNINPNLTHIRKTQCMGLQNREKPMRA